MEDERNFIENTYVNRIKKGGISVPQAPMMEKK